MTFFTPLKKETLKNLYGNTEVSETAKAILNRKSRVRSITMPISNCTACSFHVVMKSCGPGRRADK